MSQLAFADLVDKLFQREDALDYLGTELQQDLNTSFNQGTPIASSSMIQEENDKKPSAQSIHGYIYTRDCIRDLYRDRIGDSMVCCSVS
jgi:hypothetical protein